MVVRSPWRWITQQGSAVNRPLSAIPTMTPDLQEISGHLVPQILGGGAMSELSPHSCWTVSEQASHMAGAAAGSTGWGGTPRTMDVQG